MTCQSWVLRAFFQISPYFYRKIGQKSIFSDTQNSYLTHVLDIDNQFFGYDLTRGVQKTSGSRFLNFSFLADFWVILEQKITIFSKFGYILTQKLAKNEKFKNLLPYFFLYSSGLLIAKKLGF